jgi:hypothetical protein
MLKFPCPAAKKIMAFSSESLIRGSRGCVKRTRQSEKMTRRCFYRNQNILVHLLQPLGIEAEFLGHLDQLLRGFRILDGLGGLLGSVGLVSIVVGLGHRSTILDECG